MPGIEDAPREVVHQQSSAMTGMRRMHPMMILAAGAVTLFCAVGIGVMTGLIPSAHSLSASRQEPTSSPSLPIAAVATAPIGTGGEAPAGPELKAVDGRTIGQPLEKTATQEKRDRIAAKETHAVRANSEPAGASQPDSNTERTATVTSTAVSTIQAPAPSCADCGVVDSVLPVNQQGSASGAGAVVGGVLGGVLGRQIGNGRGRDVATVAGAVGGAVLGNTIEKNARTTSAYDVRVRLDDGTIKTIREKSEPGVRAGDKVRIENGHVVRN